MNKLSVGDRSRLMSRIKSRDSVAEMTFRREIWKRGFRYRVCDKRLTGKPDLVFPAHRLLVYIDGDYWHGHQWRVRGLLSLREQFTNVKNGDYWYRKIARNIERDFQNTATNLAEGWSVLRFWETDLKHGLEGIVHMTTSAIQENQSTTPASLIPQRTVAEFFAGIGLVRLAFTKHGWSTVFANDNDENKAVMYRDNFDDDRLSTADIRELTATDIPDSTLYTASFPCNDLSVAGARAGLDGNHSSMFWHFIRILREKGERRPPLILLENVVGFLKSHDGRDLEAALLALNELGYSVDALVLNAASFAPQSRPRLFIIAKLCKRASRDALLLSEVRPKQLAQFIYSHPGIRWDIRPLPSPPKPTLKLADIIEDFPEDDPFWWDEKRTSYFMNQLSDRHGAIAKKMIDGSSFTYATAFRRVRKGRSMAELRTDGIAGCLRTPRGGSGRQILFKAGKGKGQVRLVSPRECARLQGVPDDYKIRVPVNQALFGFGDAVCVPAIEWLIENYLTPVATEMIRGQLLTPEGSR